MTIFTIPCEVFVRLANAASPLNIDTPYNGLNVVRVEYIAGDAYAIATNSRVLACQYLGKTDQATDAVNILITEPLVQQCKIEAEFDGVLSVTTIPGVDYATANTTFGFNYPYNAASFTDEMGGGKRWSEWRNIIPPAVASKSSGHMFLTGEWIASLAHAAPSGRIVFPAHIDVKIPVIVRDSVDPDWFGMFLGTSVQGNTKPATRPEWI